MMKKITALALALALMLSLSTAFAWSCPGCGSEMSSKFCSECGTEKPKNICPSCGADFGDSAPKFCTECGKQLSAQAASAPTATPAPTAAPGQYIPRIERIIPNDNGTVTVKWNADGETECSIEYFPKRTNNAEADFEKETGFSGGYSYDTTGMFTLSRMVPGVEYWIGVFDGDSNGGYVAYTPTEEPQPFTAFSNMMYGWCVLRQGENEDTTVKSFIPADFADENSKCGVHLAMLYNNPGEAKKTVLQIVMEAPNDARTVLHAVYHTFAAETEDLTGWSFISLEDYFDRLTGCFGEIPLGDHVLTVYLDGEKLGTIVIPVTEKRIEATAAPTAEPTATPAPKAEGTRILRVTPQGDGTYQLVWQRSGKGPFNVYYTDHWSDDLDADSKDPRTSAYWTAETDVTGSSLMLEHLVPGRSYWLVLEDSTGAESTMIFDVPAAGDAGMNLSVEAYPRKNVNEEYTDLTVFSAAALNKDYTESYGLYLELFYDNVPQDTAKPCMWVVTLPDGVCFCEYSFDVNLFAQGSTYWECYTLDWLFGRLKAWYGEVLQGEYSFDLYVEGNYAGGTTFTVAE